MTIVQNAAPQAKKIKTFEKFHGKLELDEKAADEIIELEVSDLNSD